MQKQILFSEQQKYNQWWLWFILLAINGLFLAGVFIQVIQGQQFGDRPMSDTGLILALGFTLALTGLFFNFKLQTRIETDGIYARFFPLHIKFRHYPWEELEKFYVREYSALTEYGGWGLRASLKNHGDAFNISGDQGLQLEFKSGKKLLIGTNKPKELSRVLNELGNQTSI